MKELFENIMNELGFVSVTDNQFYHPDFGYIFLKERKLYEVTEKIYELGKYAKAEEIKKSLYIE